MNSEPLPILTVPRFCALETLEPEPWKEFLELAEVKSLTGFARATQQERWLLRQGVAHRRVGSRIIVSRHHVRLWLEGRRIVEEPAPQLRRREPRHRATSKQSPKKET